MNKLFWYIKKLFNFLVVCIHLIVYCLFHPQKIAELLFSLFSTINEFYQVSHGRLANFENTEMFSNICRGHPFAKTNILDVDPRVARPLETAFLSSLVTALAPKTIFEVGTYNGFTTLHLAKNSPDDSKIFTLDLPPDFNVKARHKISRYSYDDLLVVRLSMENIDKRLYRDFPEKVKIKELFGDSCAFNFKPYYGKMDFIYIDGNHSFEHVKSDTEQAMKMLSDNGVIIWHDYDYIIHRDVFNYLNDLSKTYRIFSIPNTRFAIYGKNLM